MKRTQTRENLIRVGRDIIVRQGFNAAGLSNILATAEVPKGSFYYYFKSKEDFGLAIIEDFAIEYQTKLKNTIGNTQLDPLVRLSKYFEAGIADMEACQCVNGCLMGNLAQELSGQSEVFRDRINHIFSDWEAQLATCLGTAREAGEITIITNTADVAAFILAGWQGAILKAKLTRSSAPMRMFVDMLFSTVLQSNPQQSSPHITSTSND